MEFGIYSFGDRTFDPEQGEVVSYRERMRRLLEEVELADQVGLDVFGIGEHHRPDYIVSAPAVVLAAAAARTKRIRLTSAVTVLSSDDPVRVFQQFAALDLLSEGRAEVMVGRGSFLESFPLFGYDLAEYDELFDEKLRLLLRLREEEHVTWSGKHRPSIEGRGVYPRPLQQPLPVWVAVGGNPNSAVRAGALGLPLMVAIIGGRPARFAGLIELYRRSAAASGHRAVVGIASHGFLAPSSKEAADIAFPAFKLQMDRIGAERGWPPLTRETFEASRQLHGADFVGTPDEVAEKILFQHELFGHDRFLLQLTVGTIPHRHVLRAIELYGGEVVPKVRRALTGGSPMPGLLPRLPPDG